MKVRGPQQPSLWRVIAAAGTMVLGLGAIGGSLAHADSPGQTYTGCLKLGLVFNVAIGSNPAWPCPSGAVKISWNQTGPAGTNGTNGSNGPNGEDGTDGASAYEVWLSLGNTGTEQDFIDSLRGPAGMDGNLALAGQSCQQGQFVTGFDQSGNLVCGAPPTGGGGADVGADCEPLNAVPSADLHNCNMSGIDLSGIDLSGADLSGADLSGADLSRANLTNASLGDADLSGANLTNATLTGAELSIANLTDANLFGADLTNAALGNANLRDANLSDAYLVNVNLTNADLTNANLSNANLADADLTNATLSNANLLGANLFGADLSGVFWANTTCPDGTNSNAVGFTCSGHLF